MDDTTTGLELRSLITSEGELRLSLESVTPGEPGPDEVVVRVEASPINPSDLGLLLGPADPSSMKASGTVERPVVTAAIAAGAMASVASRSGQSMPVGNEGAGTVIRAGADARHLIGRRVGMLGGGMYTQLRRLPMRDCIELPDGASAADGASMFVNPLTALGFVETMRAEGHTAIVHTAAASNLGQMLNRICLNDGIALVNIVRSEDQAAILRDLGANHIVNSGSPDFEAELRAAIRATGATLAFDAIGGGRQASRILWAMEAAASEGAEVFSRYGSDTFKQVYIYGALDLQPTVLDRWVGFSWSVGGWLLTPFLRKAGAQTVARLKQRVSDELTTTFASRYAATITLADMLRPETIAQIHRKATGRKYLLAPDRM